MRIRSFVVGAAAALLATSAWAQSAAGKWNASVDTPNGPFAFVFEFVLDAAGTLTGAMLNEFIGSVPIKEGTAKGDSIAFKLSIDGGPDGPMTISYTGTVKGDELLLTSKFEGTPPGGGPAESTLTATRQK